MPLPDYYFLSIGSFLHCFVQQTTSGIGHDVKYSTTVVAFSFGNQYGTLNVSNNNVTGYGMLESRSVNVKTKHTYILPSDQRFS